MDLDGSLFVSPGDATDAEVTPLRKDPNDRIDDVETKVTFLSTVAGPISAVENMLAALWTVFQRMVSILH
jgi:hypothetical protein